MSAPSNRPDERAPLRIGVMPASLRRGSLNRRLGELIVAAANQRPGVAAELIDLADYEMPIYHGDLEADEGHPAAARRLRELLAALDGLVIVSPEYNGGPSALLKNTIDWVSRVDRASLTDLAIGLAAATPGARGGVTGLETTRRITTHMRIKVLPDDLGVAHADTTLGAEPGNPNSDPEPDTAARIENWVDDFVGFTGLNRSSPAETKPGGAAVSA